MFQHAFFGLAKVLSTVLLGEHVFLMYAAFIHGVWWRISLSCSTWKRLIGHKHEKYSIYCYKWECFLEVFEGQKTGPLAEGTTYDMKISNMIHTIWGDQAGVDLEAPIPPGFHNAKVLHTLIPQWTSMLFCHEPCELSNVWPDERCSVVKW